MKLLLSTDWGFKESLVEFMKQNLQRDTKQLSTFFEQLICVYFKTQINCSPHTLVMEGEL